ncbi:MAG: flavodoxin family protein [Clostridiales bacterium]|nr:flavodoxin family protein [Clostridiales bacterium]
MRITILNGSPRKGGNTEALTRALAEGARQAGAEVTEFCVRGKRIGPCGNCDYCFTHEGCVLRDDMDEVYDLLLRTDALVFATPVYFYTMSAQLKALIDRLHNPVRAQMPVRTTAVLSVCADDDRAAFEPLLATFAAIEGYLGWRRVGEVTVANVEKKGEIAGHPALWEARSLGERLAHTGLEA